ncbi:Aerotaxis receptor [Nocardia seriolae]|uniref:Aerotaxis receptor n=1 Tax=Nocardia seriolae TaxID=37332 RepID=A0ABC9YRK0_9NOCA|nr:Aerotaxis receptor [Nocardia seriolae]GEM23327.1 hypothetical protein NS2_15660 [Nocardia seriolae NBRC 15557]OJF79405.1 hypothetical protein NS14008_09570 [Nocardia seriolae]BEK86676.1 hypothetical protein NSERKGN1266_26270 [Nocardia seriolae]BEK94431.1 hypothetical protein NSER024013_23370 [Nocardia seriolae]
MHITAPIALSRVGLPYGCHVLKQAECAQGRQAALDPAELFFSITDSRGLIEVGNAVFSRVSGYAPTELAGKPHNIVRHPDMPAGLFRLMWDRLGAGRPTGTFVRNLAADGTAYWVFATMSPVAEGYLSIRLAPRSACLELAEQAYQQARAAEERARQLGIGRRDIATIGQSEIEKSLHHSGFGSFDEFVFDALAAELAARDDLVRTAYLRPDATGAIGELLAGAVAVDATLGDAVARLADLRELCDELGTAAAQVADITRRIDRSVVAAREASEPVAAAHPVLANVARGMGELMSEAVEVLHELRRELDAVRADVRDLRFRICLASLHNSMVAAFAAEVADGTAPPRSLRAVPVLCEATAAGLAELARRESRVNAEFAAIAAVTVHAREALDRFRRFLGQWRILVLRYRAAAMIGDRLDPIDAEPALGWEWMNLLHSLGRTFAAGAVTLDTDRLRTQLAAVERASAAVEFEDDPAAAGNGDSGPSSRE